MYRILAPVPFSELPLLVLLRCIGSLQIRIIVAIRILKSEVYFKS
jgi:hypothetical protein